MSSENRRPGNGILVQPSESGDIGHTCLRIVEISARSAGRIELLVFEGIIVQSSRHPDLQIIEDIVFHVRVDNGPVQDFQHVDIVRHGHGILLVRRVVGIYLVLLYPGPSEICLSIGIRQVERLGDKCAHHRTYSRPFAARSRHTVINDTAVVDIDAKPELVRETVVDIGLGSEFRPVRGDDDGLVLHEGGAYQEIGLVR